MKEKHTPKKHQPNIFNIYHPSKTENYKFEPRDPIQKQNFYHKMTTLFSELGELLDGNLAETEEKIDMPSSDPKVWRERGRIYDLLRIVRDNGQRIIRYAPDKAIKCVAQGYALSLQKDNPVVAEKMSRLSPEGARDLLNRMMIKDKNVKAGKDCLTLMGEANEIDLTMIEMLSGIIQATTTDGEPISWIPRRSPEFDDEILKKLRITDEKNSTTFESQL